MRLVDADNLIDLVNDATILGDGFKQAFIAIVNGEPTAQPEQQWIPCSERLPDTNGIYNVTRSVSDGFYSFDITGTCYFDGSDTWYDDTRINHERKYLTDVLAWMPLPEAYKEDGETE